MTNEERDAKIVALEQKLSIAAGVAQDALADLQKAKADADFAYGQGRRKNYLPAAEFSRRLQTVRAAGQAHQRALLAVSAIKAEIRKLRVGDTERRQEAEGQHRKAFGEHFLDVARELLDPDVFNTLMQEATLRKNRDLVRYQHTPGVGSAIPVVAAVGGMRVRAGER